MNTTKWWAVIIGLLGVILVMLVLLIVIPSKRPTGSESGTVNDAPANQPLHKRVIVHTPQQNQVVSGTFPVTGEAPGNWYFEASFPVQVRDAQNNKIGQGVAQAQGDWMTANQVPFVAAVTVGAYTGPATLVLLRDNPSGLPENDDSISIPISVR